MNRRKRAKANTARGDTNEASNSDRLEQPATSPAATKPSEDEVRKNYEEKYELLAEYYNSILRMNAQLKNRIYHVRKEINHLKQLKKVLCNRLHYHDAIQMDTTLEIPDNDCVVGKSNSTWHKSAGQKRRRQSDFHGKREAKAAKSQEESNIDISSIVDSIVASTSRAQANGIANAEDIDLDSLLELPPESLLVDKRKVC